MDLKVRSLGNSPVYFISIKPSLERANDYRRQIEVNDGVRRMTIERHDLVYVDIRTAMISKGRIKNIFGSDGLHMTHAGYAIWSGVLRPIVAREYSHPSRCDDK